MSDVVALELAGGAVWLDALRRCWDAGDAVAPVSPDLPGPTRNAWDNAVRPTHTVGADGVKRPSTSGTGSIDPLDAVAGDALVITTSGTTGEPRGVVLTHTALDAAATATFDALAESADDHWLACLPLHHVGGFSVVSRALRNGLAVSVHPRFDPDAVADAVRSGATHTSLVPTALRRIDPTWFRLILLGGSAPPTSTPPNAVTTYGMTESGGGIVYDGTPLDGVEVRIVDDETSGVIAVRSPTLARCYRDGTPVVDAEGWHHTGDVGSVDPATGVLHVDGRRDDVINTGGEKVWPSAVERVLRDVASVGDVAVVGRPDPEWGEVVTAVVVPVAGGDPPTLDALRRHAKEHLPDAWAPKRIEVVDRLPTTSLGKVRRHDL